MKTRNEMGKLGIDISTWQGGSGLATILSQHECLMGYPPLQRDRIARRIATDIEGLLFSPMPVQVYFNGTNTVVEWSDGVKTKAGLNNEAWDAEKGVAMAIARRFVGRADFEKLVENAHDQRQKTGEPVKVLVIQAVMPDKSQIWYPIVLPPDNRETIEPFLEQTKYAEFGFALGS